MPAKWKHDDLQKDLATFLRETRGVLAWEDMQLGPQGSMRPDVYTIGKSYAKFRPLVYECKVSMSDFRADITKGKWHDYLHYACGVIFAAPKGLIERKDLPEGCGLIVRSDSGWRVSKAPTMKALENMPRDAWLKLLMDGVYREGKRVRDETQRNYSGGMQAMMKRYGHEYAELINATAGDVMRLRQVKERVTNESSILEQAHRNAVEQAKRNAAIEAAKLDDAVKELGESLGLTGEFTASDVSRRCRQARRRLDLDMEIQRLRMALRQVYGSLTDALEPVPGDKIDINDKRWKP